MNPLTRLHKSPIAMLVVGFVVGMLLFQFTGACPVAL